MNGIHINPVTIHLRSWVIRYSYVSFNFWICFIKNKCWLCLQNNFLFSPPFTTNMTVTALAYQDSIAWMVVLTIQWPSSSVLLQSNPFSSFNAALKLQNIHPLMSSHCWKSFNLTRKGKNLNEGNRSVFALKINI